MKTSHNAVKALFLLTILAVLPMTGCISIKKDDDPARTTTTTTTTAAPLRSTTVERTTTY